MRRLGILGLMAVAWLGVDAATSQAQVLYAPFGGGYSYGYRSNFGFSAVIAGSVTAMLFSTLIFFAVKPDFKDSTVSPTSVCKLNWRVSRAAGLSEAAQRSLSKLLILST